MTSLDILPKPLPGAPPIEPAEAVAVALSMLRWTPGRLHSPEDRAVTLVMQAIDLAGWKIVPK